MPDPTDILLKLKTEGDTSGAEKVSGALRDTRSEEQKMQAAADVAEAKRRQHLVTQNEVTASTARMGMVVNQVGYQVTDFATQVSMGTSAVQAFAQQAPQAIGVVTQFGDGLKLSGGAVISFGTAISLLATEVAVGAQMMYSQYKASMSEWEATNKRIKESNEAIKRAGEWLAEQEHLTRLQLIAAEHKNIADQIQRQADQLARVNELRGAQGNAEAAAAAAAVTVAQNTPGADVTGAKANQITVGVGNQLDALQSKLSEQEAKAILAKETLDTAAAKWQEIYAEASRKGDTETKAVQDAAAAAEAADAAYQKAQGDLENLRLITEQQKAAILSGAEASISSLGADVKSGVEEKTKTYVDTVIRDVNAVVDANGGRVSANALDAINRLTQMVNDGIPDSDQLGAINRAVQQFRSSQSTALSGMSSNFDALISQGNSLFSVVAAQKSRIDQLEATIKRLSGE